MWYKGDNFKIRFSTRKSSSLIFSLIIRAMNSETQRPSEDTECDSVKRAGSDFDLGKHNVSGELEATHQGWTGKVFFHGAGQGPKLQAGKWSRFWGSRHIHEDAKFWPILTHFGYVVAKLRTFYRPE